MPDIHLFPFVLLLICKLRFSFLTVSGYFWVSFCLFQETDYFTPQGEFRVDAAGSPTLLNCLMYKLSYYRFGELQVFVMLLLMALLLMGVVRVQLARSFGVLSDRSLLGRQDSSRQSGRWESVLVDQGQYQLSYWR